MNRIPKIILLLPLMLVIGAINTVKAQQDAQFSQYMFNQLFINPAYAGVEGNFSASLIHRTQWAGYNPTFDNGGSPNTQVLSVAYGNSAFRSGVGLHFVNDMIGPLINREAQLSYAYHVPLGSRNGTQAKLSIGVRGGFYSQTIDFDQFRALDPDDKLLQSGVLSQTNSDMAAGIYYHSNTFFGGVSMNHIIPQKFNFGQEGSDGTLASNLYVLAGYNFNVGGFNSRWSVSPSVLVKMVPTDLSGYSFDLGAITTYDNKYFAGISYRQEESASLILGLKLNKSSKKPTLQIAYGFDYVFIGQSAKDPTSHEISVSYKIPIFHTTDPKLNTPRYNNE